MMSLQDGKQINQNLLLNGDLGSSKVESRRQLKKGKDLASKTNLQAKSQSSEYIRKIFQSPKKEEVSEAKDQGTQKKDFIEANRDKMTKYNLQNICL